MLPTKPNLLQRIARLMGWTKSSYVILGLFVLTVFVIIYVWWPLAQLLMDLKRNNLRLKYTLCGSSFARSHGLELPIFPGLQLHFAGS